MCLPKTIKISSSPLQLSIKKVTLPITHACIQCNYLVLSNSCNYLCDYCCNNLKGINKNLYGIV